MRKRPNATQHDVYKCDDNGKQPFTVPLFLSYSRSDTDKRIWALPFSYKQLFEVLVPRILVVQSFAIQQQPSFKTRKETTSKVDRWHPYRRLVTMFTNRRRLSVTWNNDWFKEPPWPVRKDNDLRTGSAGWQHFFSLSTCFNMRYVWRLGK